MGTGVDGCYRSGEPEVPDGHRTDEPARLPDGAGARLALRKRIETGLAGHGEKDRAGVGRCHAASESTPHITRRHRIEYVTW